MKCAWCELDGVAYAPDGCCSSECAWCKSAQDDERAAVVEWLRYRAPSLGPYANHGLAFSEAIGRGDHREAKK